MKIKTYQPYQPYHPIHRARFLFDCLEFDSNQGPMKHLMRLMSFPSTKDRFVLTAFKSNCTNKFMNDDYRLTSSEYAKILGISTEALRTRRRREQVRNYIRDESGNYWWKRDRPDKEVRPLQNFPGPMSRARSSSARRRGAHDNEEPTNYHNAVNGDQLEVLNLFRRRLKDEKALKKYKFKDEELKEFIKVAKENVKRDKETPRPDTKYNANQDDDIRIVGLDYTPVKYGHFGNSPLDAPNRINLERSQKRWLKETGLRFHGSESEHWKRGLPDFRKEDTSIRYMKPGPYEVGVTYDDGVEVDPRSSITEEPTFNNKIEEDIWRLKNKK